MGQRVERRQRLQLDLLLKFPDINRNKSYSAIERKYLIFGDGEPLGLVDMTTVPALFQRLRVRTLVTVKKVYADKRPDSITEYRVGENFATITLPDGRKKRYEVDFEDTNTLEIKDDIDFYNIKPIK